MREIVGFIHNNGAVLSLLGLAFVVTMRDELPAPFNRVPLFVWCYGWLHDGLKTFVSFRAPASGKADSATQEKSGHA